MRLDEAPTVGNGQVRDAAGRQDALDLAQVLTLLVVPADVLEHVVAHHDVECGLVERKRGTGYGMEGVAVRGNAVVHGVDSMDLVARWTGAEVVCDPTGSAADVQDPKRPARALESEKALDLRALQLTRCLVEHRMAATLVHLTAGPRAGRYTGDTVPDTPFRGPHVKLIVMIPAFNEEATIGGVIREIPRSFDGISTVEVLVCDDGSSDGTAEAARSAGADHVVRLRRNFGLTTAFSTGMQHALALGADIIVNTDADGQYDGAQIADLIVPILAGEADMVSGDRQVGELTHMTPSKKYGNRLGSWMLRSVASSPVRDASSGFRAFSRECALRLNPFIGHTYTHQTLIQAAHSGLVVKEVPVTFRRSAREGGASRLIGGVGAHIVKSLTTIIRTLTTYRPLAVLGRLGALFLLLGVVIGLIPVINWIQQGNTEGHLQSLIGAAVLSLVGLQLLVLGLLADALSTNRRLTEEVLFLVKSERLGARQSPASGTEQPDSGQLGPHPPRIEIAEPSTTVPEPTPAGRR